MKKHWRIAILIIAALALGCVVSCMEDEDKLPPTGGGGVPAGVARLSGSVRDTSGAPLSDVFLHVIYQLGVPLKQQGPQLPSSAWFYNDTQMLTTECGGAVPIPDGVILKIYWDRNSNGPDSTDPQPPLCNDPPECLSQAPTYTVNFNEFTMNGVAQGLGAGFFAAERNFVTVGDMLSPNRFYVRMLCTSGQPLYTSQVVDIPPGYSEHRLTFTCTPCEGGLPATWGFDQSYPNPARDSVTVRFSCPQPTPVLVTLHGIGTARADTLFRNTVTEGVHAVRRSLGSRPNGLYEVRLSAGSYQPPAHTLLKNETSYARLGGTDAAATTAADGTFLFDAAAGQSIALRNELSHDLGSATLSRLTLVAMKPGYRTADTTLTIASGGTVAVNLVLRPQ